LTKEAFCQANFKVFIYPSSLKIFIL